MKNLFLIMGLCFFQCACSNQPQLAEDSGNLLRFSDLASEIKVDYQTVNPVQHSATVGKTPVGTP